MMNPRPLVIALTAFFIFIVLSSTAYPAQILRVLVLDDMQSLALVIPEGYDVKDNTGMNLVSTESGKTGGRIVIDSASGPSAFRIRAGDSVVRINEYALTGTVEVSRNRKGLYRIINDIDLEAYTRAVVGEEMSPKWPVEALKAQAVVARTYALYRKGKSGQEDYDLCATVSSQMFTGGARVKGAAALAAQATEGEVLSYNGELVEALYHSSCGGKTEDASEVWNWSLPYLRSQDCPCGKESPYASWERVLSAAEIEKALSGSGYQVAGISRISVPDRSPAGRARFVEVESALGEETIRSAAFRRIIGYQKLPSTSFDVKADGDNFIFTGKGSGHGVGLCQWGAKVMAEEGRSYSEILAHYYPGAVLSRVVSGGK